MAVVEILREGLRSGALPSGPSTIIAAQAFELVAGPADRRARHRDLARGRNDGHDPRARGLGRRGGADGAHHRQCRLAGRGRRGRDGRRDRRDGPGLVPHRRLPVADRRGGRDRERARRSIRRRRDDPRPPRVRRRRRGRRRVRSPPSSADCRTIVTIASGADRPAARELALKIEEAAWIPTTMRDLETFLHGHLPAMDATTGLVLILADRDGRAARGGAGPPGARGRARRRDPGGGDHRPRRPRPARRGADAGRADPDRRGEGAAGAGRRPDRDRDAAPAPDRADRPRPRARTPT